MGGESGGTGDSCNGASSTLLPQAHGLSIYLRIDVVLIVKEYLARRYAALNETSRGAKLKAFRKEAKILAAAALDPRSELYQLSHNAALACMEYAAKDDIQALVEAVMIPMGGDPEQVVSDDDE